MFNTNFEFLQADLNDHETNENVEDAWDGFYEQYHASKKRTRALKRHLAICLKEKEETTATLKAQEPFYGLMSAEFLNKYTTTTPELMLGSRNLPMNSPEDVKRYCTMALSWASSKTILDTGANKLVSRVRSDFVSLSSKVCRMRGVNGSIDCFVGRLRKNVLGLKYGVYLPSLPDTIERLVPYYGSDGISQSGWDVWLSNSGGGYVYNKYTQCEIRIERNPSCALPVLCADIFASMNDLPNPWEKCRKEQKQRTDTKINFFGHTNAEGVRSKNSLFSSSTVGGTHPYLQVSVAVPRELERRKD